MIIAIAVLLTILILVVLALPFVHKGRERFPFSVDVRSGRQDLYQELRLLDEERLLGHISETNYQKQSDEVKLRAAELVKQEQIEAQAMEAARAAKSKGRAGGRPAATSQRQDRVP